MAYQITCINKEDRYNPYERITHFGFLTSQGTVRVTQQQLIDYIQQGYEFVVSKSGKTAKLILAKSPFNHLYVKTEADGNEPNNLLNLMECYH